MNDEGTGLQNEMKTTKSVVQKSAKAGVKVGKKAGKVGLKISKKFIKWIAMASTSTLLILSIGLIGIVVIIIASSSGDNSNGTSMYGEATEGGSSEETIAFAQNLLGKKLSYFLSADDTETFTHDMWCAMFCRYVLKKTNSDCKALQGSANYCPTWIEALKNNNLFHVKGSRYTPKAGDLIFFGSGGSEHVGLVESYNSKTKEMKTIEGNSGSGPYPDGSYVCEHTFTLGSNDYYDSWYYGFGEVEYSGTYTEGNAAEDTVKYADKLKGKHLDYFKKHNKAKIFSDTDWCAMFCRYVLHETNKSSTAYKVSSNSCGAWAVALNKKKMYYSADSKYEPKIGDLVFFEYNGKKGARNKLDHVGLVKSYNKKTKVIKTIEGNYGSHYSASMVAEASYKRNDKNINGFGKVDYKNKVFMYKNKKFKDRNLHLPATGKATKMSQRDYDRLLSLVYCENGGESFECQVYTTSAILNLWDYNGHKDFMTFTSDYNTFSDDPYKLNHISDWEKKYVKDAVDYTLAGGRVKDIKYFRTDYYHNFGTPVYSIDNTFYSKE